jgi:hypothetical protein
LVLAKASPNPKLGARVFPWPLGSGYTAAMRSLGFGLVLLAAVLGLAFGCGQSDGGSGSAGNGAGTAAGGSSSAGTASGKAGTSAMAGTANSGSSSGGGSVGGGTVAGAGGNATTGGQPEAQAGAGNDTGGAGGLVDCDPKKILCKRLAPTCDAGEVPSVEGSCYGDCVKVEQCGCSAAEQCPEPEQYTCWAKLHCGPFVQ